MPRTKLLNQLRQLQTELQDSEQLDEETRAVLIELQSDIDSLIVDDPDPVSERYRAFRDRLRTSVERFEASHPRLTSAMAQIIDTLGAWGI